MVWSGLLITNIWHLVVMIINYLCGTWQVSVLFKLTQSTWRQWRLSPGHLTNTACLPAGVARPTAVWGSGTHSPDSLCSVWTLDHKSAISLGPNTLMSWYVVKSMYSGFAGVAGGTVPLLDSLYLKHLFFSKFFKDFCFLFRLAPMVTHKIRSWFGSILDLYRLQNSLDIPTEFFTW